MARRRGRGGGWDIEVEGLEEYVRELAAVGDDIDDALPEAHVRAADEIVDAGRSKARGLGGVNRKAAPSITSAAAGEHATITISASSHPYALGAELGAVRWKQFRPWKGNDWSEPESLSIGYALHPALRDYVASGQYLSVFEDLVDDATDGAYPD